MLKFTLQDLPIFISESSDGSFRQVREVRQFLKEQGLGEEEFSLLHLQLENKEKCIVLDKKDLLAKKPNQVFIGDAILTNLKNGQKRTNKTLISMVVADCFPIIFFDQKTKNIAMVHAGWQPLYLGVLDETWAKMMDLWQTQAENLWVFLGPGIRAESYCLAQEPRQSQDINWQKFIKQQKQSESELKAKLWQINLPAFIKDFLFKKGLSAKQLLDSGLDTYSDKRFFSHRRSQELKSLGQKKSAEVKDGRFMVVCELTDG